MSGFTRHQPRHANFKIIHHDSEETKPCHVENDTKTIIRGFLSQASICIYTIILIKTSSQKSRTRVGFVTFYNNDFAALWDCYKVFRLNKNNFLDNFSFIANWKYNFSSFFYERDFDQRVSENWQSAAADYQKWSSLGSKLTTFIDGILSKLLFQWVNKRFNLH